MMNSNQLSTLSLHVSIIVNKSKRYEYYELWKLITKELQDMKFDKILNMIMICKIIIYCTN